MPAQGSIFISYNHVDREWLDRLCVHLRPLEKKHCVEVWSDTKISPGQHWREEIAEALGRTRVAVLLISAYFLASDFITTEELPSLLRAAQEKGTVVLPLILSHCGFNRNTSLREFQAINDPHQPLIKMTRGDQEEILEKVAALVDTIFSETAILSPTGRTILNNPFNPNFLFSSFVIGKSNEFAHAAAARVAENPFHSYNPFFIYSGVGLGKTHLLHAIGQDIALKQPQFRVLYLTAEQFTNEVIESIRFDRRAALHENYRTCDVLIIDDIQFLAAKERTQEEFFHIFNTLYGSQKQIILSSDSSPRNIPTLEERLRSRFEWGLIADIQSPDLETKMAIVQRKAALSSVLLPDEVAELIARQVKSNVRELEGLLIRVIAHCSMLNKPLSLAMAREALRDILRIKIPQAPSNIIRLVAGRFGLKVSDLQKGSRSRQIVFARSVAMYFCRKLADCSYSQIGLLFSGRSRSNALDAVRRIECLRDSDPSVDRVLYDLEEFITKATKSGIVRNLRARS